MLPSLSLSVQLCEEMRVSTLNDAVLVKRVIRVAWFYVERTWNEHPRAKLHINEVHT